MITTTPRSSRREVRRSRPTIDQAWDIALAELPPDVRPAMIAYVEARQAEYGARLALGDKMIPHRLRWYDVDRLAHKLIGYRQA